MGLSDTDGQNGGPNQPDKQKKMAVAIDVAVPNDSNIRNTRNLRNSKGSEKGGKMWRVKVTVAQQLWETNFRNRKSK